MDGGTLYTDDGEILKSFKILLKNIFLCYKMPKMTDTQKSQLNKHMEGYSGADKKSHRMKMMVRMMKGMSVAEAHKDINKK